jgi:glucokinase
MSAERATDRNSASEHLPSAAPSGVPSAVPSARPVLAVDLGGTNLRTALVLPTGTVLGRRSSPTPQSADAILATTIAQLNQSLTAAREHDPSVQPVAVGISAPGPLDTFTGAFIDPPNLDHTLWGFPLASRVEQQIGLPTILERDTQVAVLAEGTFGAARGLTDYVYITVSTGIGGGVVSGGTLLRGADGLANEIGHITIDINGPVCGCGARGHLESITSGTGLKNAARAAGLGDLSGRQVAEAEDGGDPRARKIMEYAREAFAAAAVTIVDLYNPQRIVVGGAVAHGQGDRLLQPARDAIAQYAFKRQAARVELVPAQLGDDVGLVGALALVGLARLGEHADH